METALLAHPVIERRIYLIRGSKVMLSMDLAYLYEVETKVLMQAVRRNSDRFPADFMFQLTPQEWLPLRSSILRSQSVTLESNDGRGKFPKYMPFAFTEQGVAMLSSVLRSARAIQVNIAIMRTFVRLREILAANADLAGQIEALKLEQQEHGEHIRQIFSIIQELIAPEPVPPRRRIGFSGSG